MFNALKNAFVLPIQLSCQVSIGLHRMYNKQQYYQTFAYGTFWRMARRRLLGLASFSRAFPLLFCPHSQAERSISLAPSLPLAANNQN